MPFAILSVYCRGARNMTTSFEVSPKDLEERIRHTMLHEKIDFSWNGTSCTCKISLVTLLNWIEASGWTLDQMSTSQHEYTMSHTYVFKK